MFSQQDSFDQHSRNYSARVLNRAAYSRLSKVDDVILSFLSRHWPKDKQGVLMDAACGSGDRLRMLVDDARVARNHFTEIIGIDFSAGMLDVASEQQLDDGPLYDILFQQDLLKEPAHLLSADLILCLWDVMNIIGLDSDKVARHLAGQLNDDGFLIYDALSTKVLSSRKRQETELLDKRPDLEISDDPQRVWYEREDGTVGHEHLFSPHGITQLVDASGLATVEVWGLDENCPCPLEVSDGKLNEQQLDRFAKVVVMQQKVAPDRTGG